MVVKKPRVVVAIITLRVVITLVQVTIVVVVVIMAERAIVERVVEPLANELILRKYTLACVTIMTMKSPSFIL